MHKQQVKHNTNIFKLYIRNESLKIKIIRSLNYFLLLKLNVGLKATVTNQAVAGRPIPRTAAQVGEVGRRHDFERRGKWPGKLRI